MDKFNLEELNYVRSQYILVLSPKRIILGGGVMKQKQVVTSIYKYLAEFLNGYIRLPELLDYIVSPGLGDDALDYWSTSACTSSTSREIKFFAGGKTHATIIFKTGI
jgi:hypothetical protein